MNAQPPDREFGSWLDAHQEVLRPGALAIDLGCGLGDDARLMTDAGLKVIGMDRSTGRVAQAAKRAPDASFVVADLKAGLPFLSGVANLVTASLSLHYFDRRTTAAIVEDIARVQRPRAVLLCRVNVVGETVALWGVGDEHEPDFYEVEPGRFKRFFTEDSLHEALDSWFRVELMRIDETRALDEHVKKTLVARARRRT